MGLRTFFLITSLLVISFCHAQVTNDSLHSRLKKLIIASTTVYAGSIVGLNYLWYTNFPREGFHFFNDRAEWNQVDKAGHFYSAYHISSLFAHALSKVGLSDRKSDIWGAITGAVVLLPIEVLDGFSSEYGASISDLTANTLGSGFYLGQHLLWNKTVIIPKFSFKRSGIASYRPKLLGENLPEEILKDYNGQTYWLSFDLNEIFNSQKFPKWINIAFGYGAAQMVSARDSASIEAGFSPHRQYYFALDPDLSWIKTRSNIVKAIIYVINMVHIPAPGIKISKKGSEFRIFR